MFLAQVVIPSFISSLVRHRGGTASRVGSIPLRSARLAMLALALSWPLLIPAGPSEDVGTQVLLVALDAIGSCLAQPAAEQPPRRGAGSGP
jgi:hypothetical protein